MHQTTWEILFSQGFTHEVLATQPSCVRNPLYFMAVPRIYKIVSDDHCMRNWRDDKRIYP